jgi:hypothetical protein
MTAQHIFLDTQQWNYLVVSGDDVTVDVATVRESLERKVKEGELMVVGSLLFSKSLWAQHRRIQRSMSKCASWSLT